MFLAPVMVPEQPEVLVAVEQPPPVDLREQFYQILHGFKASMQPDQWTLYVGSFPEHIRNGITQMYNV